MKIYIIHVRKNTLHVTALRSFLLYRVLGLPVLSETVVSAVVSRDAKIEDIVQF